MTKGQPVSLPILQIMELIISCGIKTFTDKTNITSNKQTQRINRDFIAVDRQSQIIREEEFVGVVKYGGCHLLHVLLPGSSHGLQHLTENQAWVNIHVHGLQHLTENQA